MKQSISSTLWRWTISTSGIKHQVLPRTRRYPIPKISARCLNTQPGAKNEGPLKGVKILDLSRVLAVRLQRPALTHLITPISDRVLIHADMGMQAPLCTQILADYGAEVIKVEDVGKGDDTRYFRVSGEQNAWKDDTGPISNYFAAVNRNKRSICLNLKDTRGRDILLKLAKQADVVVDNFRPGALDRLGLGYDVLSKINPRIIHASVSGYGAVGPYAMRAGYDMIAGSEAGLLHLTGERGGPPVRPGLGVTDMCTGLFTHGAIIAALYARQISGRGQKIDASLYESQVALLTNVALAWLNLGQETERWGTQHPSVVPYDAFKTKDLYFVCGTTNERQFEILCQKLGLTDLPNDPRFSTNAERVQNRDQLYPFLNAAFAKKSTDEWMEVFEGSGLPYAPINTMERVFNHPQTEATRMIHQVPFDAAKSGVLKLLGPAVKFSDTPASIRTVPPRLGEHTDDILRELGHSQADIDALHTSKVV